MRKDSTPQVETREISDSDLDNVSGGISLSGGVSVDGVDLVSTSALPALPLGSVTGLISGVTAPLSGLTGGLTGITGIAGL